MKEKKRIIFGIILTMILVAFAFAINFLLAEKKEEKLSLVADPELKRAMTYEVYEDGDEDVEGTDNVKFSAFFLRDVDGDGYAEKIKGTCKEVETEDTLYMEVIVRSEGYLKDGKIEIDGKNFYLQTAIPKDEEVKNNYISSNTSKIEFENLTNGTQKLLIGYVRTGIYSAEYHQMDALNGSIDNYSRNDNVITFTGTYVDANNHETEIEKVIDFSVDWYGTTRTTIKNTSSKSYRLNELIDENEGIIRLDFKVTTNEADKELFLKSAYVHGIIPTVNGYAPVSVRSESVGDFTYDEETREFTVLRNAVLDDNNVFTKKVANTNDYYFSVDYPIEAYSEFDDEKIILTIPITAYYEGYNNTNSEFTNPYRSNVATRDIVASFEKEEIRDPVFAMKVGKRIAKPEERYIVSKEKPIKLYRGVSSEETDDRFIVEWSIFSSTIDSFSYLVIKETPNNSEQKTDLFIKSDHTTESIEYISSNVGIYFQGATNLLGVDGEINVYDDTTGTLIHTFTASEWGSYSEKKPYMFENPVQHIKIVTSATIKNQDFKAFCVKELDDEAILDRYDRAEFDTITSIQSEAIAYFDTRYAIRKEKRAKYEQPLSIVDLKIVPDTISTQSTEGLMIYIDAKMNRDLNQAGWVNGTFLVKLPENVLTAKINSVVTNNVNINILSYEIIENNGNFFVKVITENTNEEKYLMSINMDITTDPRIATMTKTIELYSINDQSDDYYYNTADIYDINANGDTQEIVSKRSKNINLVAPNGLITNQIASEYNEDGDISISPQVAELKPIYSDEDIEKQTVKIGAQIKNNYSNTISEIQILGKIPFVGNTYVLGETDLNSEFTTTMKNTGIIVPSELEGNVSVYYSSNPNPTADINDSSNGWTLKENVTNWATIKSWLVDFGDTKLAQGKEYTFSYIIEIPFEADFNETAYSHHGVYFCLDTEQGKYKTRTEPNKLGIMIADKYNVVLKKYQKNKNNLVEGATYIVNKLDDNGDIEESQTARTNSSGTLEMANLYAERSYEIKEILTPENYELNDDIIKIVGHINRTTGVLTVEKLAGTTRSAIQITKNEDENYKAHVEVEDEMTATIDICKLYQIEIPLRNARFKVTGEGLPENGKILTTGNNGHAEITGIKIGSIYTIEEVKAPEGYYLDSSTIDFKVVNNNGLYEIKIKDNLGNFVNYSDQYDFPRNLYVYIENNDYPNGMITFFNEKIPTYDLVINKIEKGTGVNGIPAVPVEGAKFNLYYKGKEIDNFETDSSGCAIIYDLYQYVDGKDLDATYVLKEVLAPEGYAKIKDITFKVEENSGGTLDFIETLSEGQSAKRYTSDSSTVELEVEDPQSFKLIKKDAETDALLPNTKFAIFNIDEGERPATNSKGEIIGTKETINDKEYYTLTTNQNGEIIADLPEGFYKAVEVEADDKYDINSNTKYFGIGKNVEANSTYVPDWIEAFGDTDNDYITDIKETSDGGYIVVGTFQSNTLTIGGRVLTNMGGPGAFSNSNPQDMFIVKYSSDREIDWITSFGGLGNENIKSVAETKDGGFVVGGYFFCPDLFVGNYTFSNNSTSGNGDAFLVKFDVNGNILWANSYGSTNSEHINSIVATEDGGFITGGSFSSDTLVLGNTTLNRNGSDDALLIKYYPNGNIEWITTFGGTSSDTIECINCTNNGKYLIAGSFGSTITINNQNYTSNGAYDAFVMECDSNGNINWAKTFGNTGYDYAYSVDSTENGDFYVAVHFYNNLVIDGITLTNKGSSDACLLKFNASKELKWAKALGTGGGDSPKYVMVTPDNGCIFGGYFSGDVTVGDFSITNHGGTDIFLVKYNSEGKEIWATGIGSTGQDYIRAMEISKDGGLIVGGSHTTSNLEWNNNLIINKGQTDSFFVKYDIKEIPSVNISNVEVLGGKSKDYILTMNTTKDGGYAIGGYFISDNFEINDQLSLAYTNGNGIGEAFFVKYNEFGVAELATSFDGYDSNVRIIKNTEDGGHIVIGTFVTNMVVGDYQISNSGGKKNEVMIKYSATGEVEWARAFGGIKNATINKMEEAPDGGFFVSGYFTKETMTADDYTLSNNSSKDKKDAFLVKYNSDGENQWATSYGGLQDEDIMSICATSDGGCLVGGYFSSDSIVVGDYIFSNSNIGYKDALLIKYNSRGMVEWASSFGDINDDQILSVSELKDGGFVVGGSTNDGTADGFIIRYDKNYNKVWEKKIDNTGIMSVVKGTSDGGYAVVGNFSSATAFGPYMIEDYGLIKYSADNEIEWAKMLDFSYGTGSSNRCSYGMTSLLEVSSDKYILAGRFAGPRMSLEDFELINHSSAYYYDEKYDPFLITIEIEHGGHEVQELEIKNKRKEFRITTGIKEIDGVKGGSISGEGETSYEKIKYGDNSTKQIEITPDSGYEIADIKINGEEYLFTPLNDGSYIMPQFNNVVENKHILVTFVATESKITINKTDYDTGSPLEGAVFRLDQIDERTVPNQNVIGNLTGNGITYTTYGPNLNNEITGVMGPLTNNGTYYFVDDGAGSLVPTNSKTWITANVPGGTYGVGNSTANSYIQIDLSQLSGKYFVCVNARGSSEETYDVGYATVNKSTSAPSYSNTTGRFMYLHGSVPADNYFSGELEGGSVYYLHLGYRKDRSGDKYEDWAVINSIKVYGAEAINNTYNFINENGAYKSSNQGVDNTQSDSYVEVDLQGLSGKYFITVNAEISSQSSDYGYAGVTQTTDRLYYSNTNNFIKISGTVESKDYSYEVEGGQKYYLHFGYYKNASISSGTDTFTINSISVRLSDSELFHSDLIRTNSQGQAITTIPFGKYAITEVSAPNGYDKNNSSTIINFTNEQNAIHEFTITNRKTAHVIVHHYKKGTTEKVAEDDIVSGSIGDTYLTGPKLDLSRYRLEEVSGELVLPNNMTGTFTYNDIEVNYYYVAREIPLIVHHYVEGTIDGVPLANGDVAEDVITYGNENANYTTSPISSSLLDEKYELVEMPENSSGTYTYDEVEVTYYYRIKDSLGYVVHHVNKVTGEKIVEDEIHSGGKYGDSYTTTASTDIPANYEYDSRTSNWQGTLVDTLTEITYYYDIVLESKSVNANKTSNTTLVNAKDQEIDYCINYLGSIDDYIGQAKVTIVDNLTYEIDENLSNLNGGTYDSNAKTITWETTYLGIDTYSDGVFDINITKNITLVYEDLDASEDELINSIDVKLTTYVNGIPSEEEDTFELDIPQNIVCTGRVLIKKDNDNWNNSTIKVELRSNDRTYTDSEAEKENNEVTWNQLKPGTYSIYASKGLGLLTTYVDTGVDITVEEPGEATIDYYTLNLNKGVGISAVSGAGVYLKGQAVNIDATVSNGYTWEGWSVISGDSPN